MYPERNYRDRRSTLDKWSAAMTTIIAVCALFVAADQARQIRLHDRLSVRPLLVSRWQTVQGGLVLDLRNEGLGPALVTGVQVRFDHKPLQGTATQQCKKLVALLLADKKVNTLGDFRAHPLGSKSAVRAGGDVELLTFVKSPHSVAKRVIAMDMMRRIDMTIRYNSMYGESFVLSD